MEDAKLYTDLGTSGVRAPYAVVNGKRGREEVFWDFKGVLRYVIKQEGGKVRVECLGASFDLEVIEVTEGEQG